MPAIKPKVPNFFSKTKKKVFDTKKEETDRNGRKNPNKLIKKKPVRNPNKK